MWWELKYAKTLKGKRKSWWNNSSAVEKGHQFKVTHFNIVVCGVLTCC
jgi:hypothetical protein